MTSNEIRQVIGMKPSDDPKADELRNKNLSESAGTVPKSEEETPDDEVVEHLAHQWCKKGRNGASKWTSVSDRQRRRKRVAKSDEGG